jgi:hypothetical protein
MGFHDSPILCFIGAHVDRLRSVVAFVATMITTVAARTGDGRCSHRTGKHRSKQNPKENPSKFGHASCFLSNSEEHSIEQSDYHSIRTAIATSVSNI